jgi:Phosphodiester glycosidase
VKRVAASVAVLLLLCTACRKPTQQSEAGAAGPASASAVAGTSASASNSAGAASAASLAPVATGDVEVPGLRVQTGVLGPAARWGFSNLALDGSRTQLRIALAQGGANLESLLPPGALAAVNGGYFEPDFRPTTWLVDESVELARKADTSKGGVLAFGSGGLYLGPFSGLGFRPVLAVQSFPLVVEGEGQAGVYRDDGRRAARTVACLVGTGLHFIVIAAPRGDGPTLFESAALLRQPPPAGFGCRRALNLDGGPSSGVWFSPEVHAKQRPPFAKVGYAIVISAR